MICSLAAMLSFKYVILLVAGSPSGNHDVMARIERQHLSQHQTCNADTAVGLTTTR